MNSSELRKQIQLIRLNSSLTEIEKNKQIQKLMMNNYTHTTSKSIILCDHYPNKKCSNFYFECCNLNFNCHRCHNEYIETNNLHQHKPIIKSVECIECGAINTNTNNCVNCSIEFAKSHCIDCGIWTDIDIYHCIKCGLCRKGTQESLFHCDNCNICFNKTTQSEESHKCNKISYVNSNCGFCFESVFTSQSNSIMMKCNHIVHKNCLDKAYENNDYKCPICRKSTCIINWSHLDYLISIQPMPNDILVGNIVDCNIINSRWSKFNSKFLVEEIIIDKELYKGYIINSQTYEKIFQITVNYQSIKPNIAKIDIYCNDCESNTNTNFHYLGNKCTNCGSYNTSR
jgi:hypothetical protein